MRLTACVVVTCGVTLIAASQPEPIAQRIVRRTMTLNLPLGPCEVPNVVLFLARDVQLPAGAEFLPVSCAAVYSDKNRPPITDRIPLTGMRLGEAIELLNKTDPRYHTKESDGVIVVRPLEAWINDKHFLHNTIEKLELTEENIGGALEEIVAPFWRNRRGRSMAATMSGFGKITISIGPVAVVEALDAIVRTHGAAQWEISYCGVIPEVAADLATVFLHTYDDHRIGAPVAPRRQVNGRSIVC